MHEGQLAHPSCIRALQRAAAPPTHPSHLRLPSATTAAAAPSARASSKRKAYEDLRPTQQRRRRQLLREAADHIGCPLSVAVATSSPAAAAALVHLSRADRQKVRSIEGITIPSERSVVETKLVAAQQLGTATATFERGAYITDPLTFVNTIAANSPLLAVGGDAGGGHTKLGVTYSVMDSEDGHRSQTFAALLVYEGSDHWDELSRLEQHSLTPFCGASAEYPNIFAVLQHLLNERKAFLNGDWSFINTILGLKSAAARHPCPICVVSSGSLLRTARYRDASDSLSMHPTQHPLLTVPPERIVPTPLHLFLGISNRIILEAFSELLGKDPVLKAMEKVKTVHSVGCGGLADLYDLNGAEITKWLHKACSQQLAQMADLSPEQRASHSILSHWLTQLHSCLLHKLMWDADDIAAWRNIVNDIHRHWCTEAKSNPFPKLHMLHHTVEFAERYRFLGRASEAQIESFHAQFNSLFHQRHRNQGAQLEQRLRRSLADAALKTVQPYLLHAQKQNNKR